MMMMMNESRDQKTKTKEQPQIKKPNLLALLPIYSSVLTGDTFGIQMRFEDKAEKPDVRHNKL
jgi:hypothetical protein